MDQKNRKCPFCGEEIRAEATKCRFCGEFLKVDGKREDRHFNGLWLFLLLLVIPILLFFSIREGNAMLKGKGDTASAEDEQRTYEPVSRPPLSAESVDRLSDGEQILTTVITTKGRGEHAKWGLKTSGMFVLNYVIECRAKILSKKKTPLGDIEVVEKRTYDKMKQILQVSDTDVGLALSECLPMKMVTAACAWTAGLFGVEPTAAGAAVATGVRFVDGKSVKALLGAFGGDLGAEITSKIDEFVKHKVNDILKTGELEGKTYIITYVQDHEDGRASNMRFAHEDGSTDLTEEEYLVLRRANAFMDSQLMPDRNCSPGSEWTVDAADFDSLLDPFVDGSYDGSVTVARKDNDENGNWVLELDPSVVKIKSKNKTTGSVELRSGRAYLDGTTLMPKTVQIIGRGEMECLTRHHLLFKARLAGKCEFDAKISIKE